MKSVCFRLSEPLAKAIDDLAQRLGYTSRSDLIRDALKALIREKEEKIREITMEIEIIKKPKRSRIIKEIKVLEV